MKNSEKLTIQGYINTQSSQGNMYFIGGTIILLIGIILSIGTTLQSILLSVVTILLGIIYMILGVIYCAQMYKRTKKLEKIEKEIEYEQAIEKLDLLPKNGFLPWT